MRGSPHRSGARLVPPLALALASWLAGSGCVREVSVPQPEAAIDAYAAALQAGDADAVYGLLSEDSRRAISREALARILGEQKQELTAHAKALASDERSLTTQAQIHYQDGEIVTLDLVDGRFRIAAADALPAAPRTPAQALGQLRRVLARRSYQGLLRLLSPRTRSAIEDDLRSLVEGLNNPESLIIDESGDRATVAVPGGHEVRLRREDGIWHVDDFN